MDEISIYFPNLTPRKLEQFAAMGPLYTVLNQRVNVVSRKDIDNIYSHHILHSLAIAKFLTPVPGATIMDLGTGGGFPGIPLAVLWPECHFHLIDRIGKKIEVARTVAREIGLDNVTFQHGDAGECHDRFGFVVSRAVMPLPDLIRVASRNIRRGADSGSVPNGLICLKGGDLSQELAAARVRVEAQPVTDWFPLPFFEQKQLIYVPFT